MSISFVFIKIRKKRRGNLLKIFLRILTVSLATIGFCAFLFLNTPEVKGVENISIISARDKNKEGAFLRDKEEVEFRVKELATLNKEEEIQEKSKSLKEEPKKEETVKKVEESKINYSDTIPILVTKEQKERVDSQLEKLDLEVEMLAKVIYREAGGIEEDSHKAAVAWCILNRVDSEKYDNSINEVITAKSQFAWIPNTPIKEDLYNLSKDVVTRWLLEKEGIENVGRTLPSGYFFFNGDGQYNHFRESLDTNNYWDWSYGTPYED